MGDNRVIVSSTDVLLTHPIGPTLARVGAVARRVARQAALRMYQDTLSNNTLTRHKGDLEVFSRYLHAAGEIISSDDLMYDLKTWEGANEGLLEAFKQWQLEEGYSIGSVNVRLSTIKKYCEVAAKGGFIDPSDLGLIKSVYGYRGKAGRNADEKRSVTRVGNKKAVPVSLTPLQVEQLLSLEGSRDRLLMYLFLRLGFRVGEVASLEVSNIDINSGRISLYRQKTDISQIHDLRWGGIDIVRSYLDEHKPSNKLFIGEDKLNIDGTVRNDYTVRAMQKRVQSLGRDIGIEGLSPHDLRHHFATAMARNKTHIKDMQDAGGWASPYMPLRYAESNKIANEGVVLS